MLGILDCTGLSAERQKAQLIEWSAKLQGGERFIYRTDLDPARWLAGLDQAYPGSFAWRPVESSPGRYTGVLGRTDVGLHFDGVLDYMSRDHDRIHRQLDVLQQAIRQGEVRGLQILCSELLADLRRHFHLEEKVIFPAVRGHMTDGGELVRGFEREHVESAKGVRAVGNMLAELSGSDGQQVSMGQAIRTLGRLLGHHSDMEERFLYVVTDMLLSESERTSLLNRLRRG